ncbi:MAG: aminopeptidase [Leptonema sp. (in: bacteria)]
MKAIYNFFNFFLIFYLFNCIATEPFYILTQGYRQVNYLLQRKKISEILKDPSTPEKLKEKLELLNEIKKFASTKLKLNTKNQFEYLLEVQGSAISYLVIASNKTQLIPKKYWFPLIGTIHYLGFFDKQDAIEYSKYLENQNWDVKVVPVDAYSTLGWFSDPILSYHLEKDEITLASLVIHELTHNTFWKQNDNNYNETLATFIEEMGTVLYIEEKKNQKKELKDKYKKYLEEKIKINNILFEYKKKLQELYSQSLLEEEILQKKEEIFTNLKKHFKEIQKEFVIISIDYYLNKNYNNADFVLLNLYDNQELTFYFKKVFQECNRNFECFWKKIKN